MGTVFLRNKGGRGGAVQKASLSRIFGSLVSNAFIQPS